MNHTELLELFVKFCTLSLVAVGGALATAGDMFRFMVDEKQWLNAGQFADSVSLAQIAPGPNILFVTVLGLQAGGISGAIAATLGILLPSSVLVLAGYRVRTKYQHTDLVKALGIGLAPLALGLIGSTGLTLAGSAHRDPILIGLLIVAVLLSVKTKMNPLWILAIGAVVGILKEAFNS
jgi:chromate transporter